MKIFFGGLFAINIILSFCVFVWRMTGNPIVDRVPVYIDYIWMVVAGVVALIALARKFIRR